MSRIFWDTNLFIYYFEGRGELARATHALRTNMNRRGDQLLTSALALGEILVKRIEAGDGELVATYRRVIEETAIVIPFDGAAAIAFARARAQKARAPDAMHLACAAAAGVDLFITNDDRLGNIRLDGIPFIAPLGRAPV